MNDSEKVREYAGRLLRSKMSELSEELYCAGWCHGIEYVLWDNVTGSRDKLDKVNSKDVEELRQLSGDAGGWFVWDGQQHDARFVPMHEWLRMYGKRRSNPAQSEKKYE